ncbi:non-homologous end-joining DNA ligase [Paenibacillus tepidiphilus]|uniref:non-homologous end-joining DNA ligase n=1 Tax=Paenibacillus tepidiphilus TaxID=2608683 RepID=UPI0012383F8A|nr:non-homologous end-joining DNA ligase [Paenibacillus tepidiphilus]
MSSNELEVEGNRIAVTHPGKLLWPEAGIRKADYLGKLIALAPYLLPYCRNRYLTTIRYPGGVDEKPFYQKNAPGGLPDFVDTADHNAIRYVNLNSLSTLLWLGNLDALEFHPSFEFIGGEEPAEWVLDIDPSEGGESGLMEAVSLIGETLVDMGIASVPKTSGATGVQIIIPLQPGYTFDQLRKLGSFTGHYLADKYPKLFTVERRLRDREGRIYIDYVQHAAGKSLAAPYTPRGRAEATVSTPLTWEEVRQNADPKAFHLLNIEERLQVRGDLLAEAAPQNLDAVLDFVGKQGSRLRLD